MAVLRADARERERDPELQARLRARRENAIFLYIPFFIAVALTFAVTPDDGFITLRYAANLVHGEGLAFNSGQHVQGFTSPLDLLVAVIAYLAPGGLAMLKMKFASVVFGFLAVREGGRLLFNLDIPVWARRAGCLAVSTCAVIAFASGNGLETSLEMWLLIAVASRLVRGTEGCSSFVVGTFAFAAILARPDAIAPLACMALAGLVVERSIDVSRRAKWFVGAVIGVGLTAIGELILFDSILPNTYYAKDMPLGRSISLGYTYLSGALQPIGPIGRQLNFVLILQCLFFATGTVAVFFRFRRCGYLVAAVVGQVLFILKSGGDWMVGGRFLAPAAIPFIAIEVLGAIEFTSLLERAWGSRLGRSPVLVMSLLLVSTSIIPLVRVNAPISRINGLGDESLIKSGQYPLSNDWALIPSLLQCLPRGTLVASTEIGYLGFARQDLRLLDLRGLTDSAIARDAPSSMKQRWGVQDTTWYLQSSPLGRAVLLDKPSVVVSVDPAPEDSIFGGHYRLVGEPRLNDSVWIYAPESSRGLCAARSPRSPSA